MKRLAVYFIRLAVVAVSSLAIVMAFGAQPALAVDFFPGSNPDDVCSGAAADSAACSGTGDDILTGNDGVILRAAELIAIVAGIAAVITIIIAGIMFITASGDANKISTAKKTVIYAVVGLLVIVLARAIVIFVVGNL